MEEMVTPFLPFFIFVSYLCPQKDCITNKYTTKMKKEVIWSG